MPAIDFDFVVGLAGLIAAHGVYALTVISIFYQQRRAVRNLREATPKNEAYFRRVHASTVVCTYVLMALATTIWFYASFVYDPTPHVRGSIVGLREQSLAVRPEDGTPPVVQEIAPEFEEDVKFYERRRPEYDREGHYQVGWILLLDEEGGPIVFKFAQTYTVKLTVPVSIELAPSPTHTAWQPKTIEKTFILDWNQMPCRDPVELRYKPKPDASVTEVGTLHCTKPDGELAEIRWREEGGPSEATSEQPDVHSLLERGVPFEVLTAYARVMGVKQDIFQADGTYDPYVGLKLRQELSSSDLKMQLRARRILITSEARSFKFIKDELGESSDSPIKRGNLVRNLAEALLGIEWTGTQIPPELQLEVALASYWVSDYRYAALFFSKVEEKHFDRDEIFFYRGTTFLRTKRYDEAIESFQQFLARTSAPYARAVTHNSLGDAYCKLGKDEQAVRHYRKAMQIYPDYPVPYNNLAYLYAERKEKLSEALRLVNRALDMKDKSFYADYRDTKGWVYYKMGKYELAVSWLEWAARDIPDGSPNAEVVQTHLKAAKAKVYQ